MINLIMITGMIFGCIGIVSFIHTNNNLQKKYYNNKQLNNPDLRTIYNTTQKSLNRQSSILPFGYHQYTSIQKFHYLLTVIMFILFNGLMFDLYFNGYTKLHLLHSKLVYMPLDIIIAHFINSTIFYFYHRLAHTKYIYKYIHSYHHSFAEPLPFDSLIGHPIDHTCAAICQVIPMFIYPMHIVSFLIYSSILSLSGIYDHSGLDLKYFNYSTLDHHIHHKYPNKNFGSGFPILIWDKLGGTYKKNI